MNYREVIEEIIIYTRKIIANTVLTSFKKRNIFLLSYISMY